MRPSAQPFLWKRVLFAWEWEPSPYQRLSAPLVWRSIRMFKPSSRYCFPLILNVWKQDEANPVFDLIGCLPHWCRWKKFSFWPYYISFINHACSIKMVAYWPRFVLSFDWPWLRLGPTLCARGFSSAVSGFGQVLNSDPLEKHALLTSVMAGYLPIFFFFFVFVDQDTLGTRGIFLRATTSFVDRRRRTRAAKPREKTFGTQGISVYENAKSNLANIKP